MQQRLGTVSFQSNDRTDVFAVQEVWENGVEATDETFLNIIEAQFEPDKAWVTGKVPSLKPVDVDGDTAIIQACFKGENYFQEFYLTIYLECEMAEEVDGQGHSGSSQNGQEGERTTQNERQIEVYM